MGNLTNLRKKSIDPGRAPNCRTTCRCLPAAADGAERDRVPDDGDERLRARDGGVEQLHVGEEAVVHELLQRGVGAARGARPHRAEEDRAELLPCGTRSSAALAIRQTWQIATAGSPAL